MRLHRVVVTSAVEHTGRQGRSSARNRIKREAERKRRHASRIGRIDALSVVKQRLQLQQWELFDTIEDRIFLNMINVYDVESYKAAENAYKEITHHIKRIEAEIDILRLSMRNDTCSHDDTNGES